MKSAIKVKQIDKILTIAVGLLIAGLLCLFIYYAFLRGPAVIGVLSHGDERVDLPDGNRLVIQIRDVSYVDATSELIVEQVLEDVDALPIRFRVGYDPADFSDQNTYGLSVRVYDAADQLLFINDTAYEVITRGNSNRVDIDLVAVKLPDESLTPPDGRAVLEGVITYNSDENLPTGAVMTVHLRDLANQDNDSNLVAEQVIVNPAPFAVSFRLGYAETAVSSDGLYALYADISFEGQELFASGVRPGATLEQLAATTIDLEPVRRTVTPQEPESEPEEVVSETPAPPEENTTSSDNQASYDNQLNLPAGSKMVVRLEQLSQEPFAGNILIYEQTIDNPGQSPVGFSAKPADELDGNRLYLVLIRVYGPEGQTILTNNFPNKAYRPNELTGLNISLEIINPPADSPLADQLTGIVTGQVTYGNTRQTEGAKLIAQIIDTSLADAPSDLIAEQVITDLDKSPTKFEIRYDKNKIRDRHTYSLSMRIVDAEGRLLFINDTVYEVITRGHPKRGLSVPLKKI